MRERHVLVAAVAVCLLLPFAGVLANGNQNQPIDFAAANPASEDGDQSRAATKPGKQEPTIVTRHDLMARIDTGTAKAASLLARAEGLLLQGNTFEAISLLNQITSMDLLVEREADKIVATAYLNLGNIYNTPEMYPGKAASFFGEAVARMDREEELVQIVDTLATMSDIHAVLGNDVEVSRIDAMLLDIQLGVPVEIEFDASQSAAAPLDTGDDTCDAAVAVPVPHQETMSIKPAFDENWRKFTLTAPRVVVISTLDADTSKDTKLELHEGCPATGNDPIYADDDGGPGLLSLIETNCLDAGDYWTKVSAYSNNTPENFTFTITDAPCPIPPDIDEYEPDDEIGLASRIGFRNNGVGEGNQNGRDNKQIQHHSFYPTPDLDWVTFSLSRANWVNIETFGVEGENPDTLMGIVNSGGLLFAVADDKEPGVGTSKMGFCLPPGDWFVPILPFDGQDEFSYDVLVDVDHPCLFEEEPNGRCDMATEMTTGDTWYGLHEPSGLTFEDDWWTFTIDERSMVTIETGAFDSFISDTFLELYDECGGPLIEFDDDDGEGLLSKIEVILDPGTYQVKMTLSPIAFFTGEMWDYSISVTLAEPPLAEMEPNDSCGEANAVSLGEALLASIDPVGDRDHFMLTVPADGYVEIETDGPFGDTVLNIASMDGSVQIGCDDDGGNGIFSKWGCCLPAGDYCVAVKDYANNGTIPAYTIEFRDLGVCTPGDPLQCSVSSSSQCDPF
jgi:hypothetical protein